MIEVWTNRRRYRYGWVPTARLSKTLCRAFVGAHRHWIRKDGIDRFDWPLQNQSREVAERGHCLLCRTQVVSVVNLGEEAGVPGPRSNSRMTWNEQCKSESHVIPAPMQAWVLGSHGPLQPRGD